MKSGINQEYDNLRKELFELRYKIRISIDNNEKQECAEKADNCLKRMKEIELLLARSKK